MDFIENKGQWNQEARFKADIPGGAMFLTNEGFVFNYVSMEDMERVHRMWHDEKKDVKNEIIRHHAYKVKFSGANLSTQFNSESPRSYYHNYLIGNNSVNWAGHVGLFGKVVHKDIYQGIDMAVYSKNNNAKYDFIVAPGANPDAIAMTYEGVVPELTAEGNLRIRTSVNEIVEQAPYSYQLINGREVPVASRYKLTNGKLSFTFPAGYDASQPLIIDPVLVFATYSGGTNTNNYSYCTTYDAAGNLYAGADSWSTGWPTTSGAYQENWAGGGHEAAINKYNATGNTLIYSTYLGGTSQEYPHAMKVNDNNELVVVGCTQSANFPTSPGCYDNTLSGSWDIFVSHLSADGSTLVGGTLMGGAGIESQQYTFTGTPSTVDLNNSSTSSPLELTFDAAGNIWCVGNTNSTDFPVTPGAQQAANAGTGTLDGVIFKLNPTCSSLLYSSYLGGSGNEGPTAIIFNNAGNLLVSGITNSTNFPGTTGGMIATAPGGTYDGFVALINPNTGALIQTTYVGTDNVDQAVNLQVDESDNVFVLGRTTGNYPISPSAWVGTADGDVFVDKLNPGLTASLLSTRVGNPQSGFSRFFPSAFLVDICRNIYVAGFSAVAGMPLSNDAYQTNTASFWFCAMTPNFGDLLFGSYFGVSGDHSHIGSHRLDPNGIVYHSICQATPASSTTPYPGPTPNSFSQFKQTSGQDILSFKFNFEASGVNSNFQLDPTVNGNDSGCAPYTIHLINNSVAAENYTWDFGDGSATSNLPTPSHTYTVPGVYTLSLHANNDTSCITDDTAYMTITVLHTELPNITVKDTTVCSYQQAINIGVTIHNPSPNNIIQWGPATGILSPSNQANISVDPTVSNRYWVMVKDTIPGICGFSSTDTVHIDLRPRVLDIVTNDTVVCQGAVVPIVAIGTNGYTYNWSPATGVSDTTALQPVITINQPNIYTLTASYPDCPDTSVIISFDMHYIPKLDLGPDKDACQWTDVALESSITPFRNDYIYQWVPATPNLSNPNGPNTHLSADTTITYTLQVQTPIGCADQDSITLTVYPGAFGAATADTGYCPGGQAQLWATGGVSYTWSPAYGLSDSSAASPLATPLTSTDYTVLIKDVHNCADTEQVSVQVYSQAMLNLPDSVTVYPGEQYHVEPGTNCMYFTWFPPSGLSATNIADPLISPAVRTRYFVTASTEHGCMIKDSMDVLVKKTVIDMPNAFAPAGNNKVFKPAKRGIAQLKNFTIFNRWGNKVYTSANIDEGWDGTKDGKVLPMGVYIYIIEAVTDSGEIFTQEGNVTLIR
ncbi:DUF7948 domain-containing protein [Taibaiella koreensis]|uniref:DUF7948 domain-containing protein n=1 Tax=Taibaiella koreensis TaxID=1268548 RepID=UPI0013C30F6A|nr:gliding motility-associated C-terminal domain-containing protein [Taibaiella koreensis]